MLGASGERLVIYKHCHTTYHFCFSCGVENIHDDYCSFKCLREDGKKICPVCVGWGQSGHPEEFDIDGERCPGYVDADE